MKTNIALPKGPKADQLAALFLYVTNVLRCGLEDVQLFFGRGNHPADVVDLDCEVTYTKKGKFSATEAVACDHQLLSYPGVTALVRDLNLNNGSTGEKGGWLKKLPFSFVSLVRDLVDMDLPKEEIVVWCWRIFSAYFYIQLKIKARKTVVREGWEEFAKTLPETGNSSHPLTLGGYILNLWQLGYSEWGIRMEALFWRRKFEEAKDWKEAGEKAAQLCNKKFFALGSKRMVCISTAHPRVAGKLFRQNTIAVVNHNPVDDTIVMLTRLPHGSLDELRRHLPGWHLERRYQYPMLLHGSQSRDQRGYWKDVRTLVRLARQYVKVD